MNAPAEQGSAAWLQQRMGQCTASRFKDVLDFTKAGNEGAKRAAYRMELVIERITGSAFERFVTEAMAWGTEQEPAARMAYESLTGALVEQTGFVPHPSIPMCGGSPDGLIDDDGGVEFKCPTTPTHIKAILSGECEHLPQIQGLMWITGRQWFDYCTYDPRLPHGLRLHVQRVKRDEEYIAKLSAEVIRFLSEVDAIEKKLLAISRANSGMFPDAEPETFDWRTSPVPPMEP